MAPVSSQPVRRGARERGGDTPSGAPSPAGTSSSPGLVQNCPMPRVKEPDEAGRDLVEPRGSAPA